jgi:hypothetical protein
MTVTTKMMAAAGGGTGLTGGIQKRNGPGVIEAGGILGRPRSGHSGLGQFDRHAQVDLRQNLVEPIIAGGVMKVGRYGL